MDNVVGLRGGAVPDLQRPAGAGQRAPPVRAGWSGIMSNGAEMVQKSRRQLKAPKGSRETAN